MTKDNKSGELADIIVELHDLVYRTSAKKENRCISPADHYACQKVAIDIQSLIQEAVDEQIRETTKQRVLEARIDELLLYESSGADGRHLTQQRLAELRTKLAELKSNIREGE